MTDTSRRLPLHDRHVAAGARFAPFAGWDMPVWYTSIKDEHMAVRQRAGLFDVSHMGEVFVRGPEALEAVGRLITNDLSRLSDGQALYTVMCRHDGTAVDDLIVYRLAADEVLICVNAGNRAKDFAWIVANLTGDATATDESDQWAQLAAQGPQARERVASVTGSAVMSLGSFCCAWVEIAGSRCLVARTGYTGEDGFEIYIPVAAAHAVFDALVSGGVEPLPLIGLGARDSLRLEARLPLYGHELSDAINPIEAGLSWVVKTEGRDFIGRDALAAVRAAGPSRRLRGLFLEGKGMLRGGYEAFIGDRRVGVLTSGSIGYAIGEATIGLAFLDADVCDVASVEVVIRDRRVPARVTNKPFYKRA